MKALAFIVALSLAAAPAAAGQLYKWVDTDGNLHYTDQPPPAEAKISEQKKFGDSGSDAPMSYALQQAIKNFPVTLYSADQCGDACNKASALLSQRGIPFTQKDAREPAVAQELKALNGGKVEVPFMKLGGQIVRGYEENSWNSTLDAAGYPKWAVTRGQPQATPKSAQPPGKSGANVESAAQSSVIEPQLQ